MAVPGDARDRLQGGGLKMAAVPEDPFAHLHDEAYAAPLHRFRRGHRDLISLAGRPTESLCGEWRMTLDLFDEGLRQKWYALDDTPPSQWAVPRDYEAEAGTKVPVPSCWNLLRDEWRYFEGAAWYARDIGFQPGPAGERQFLHFEGVAHAALVFVNGICVGGHLGGSTPFSCEIGGALQAGSNRILVMVENRRRPERVPMDHFDWFNYGGIHREVFLVRVPPVFLRRVGISLASDAPEIEIVVELSDPADGTARVAIAELAIDAPVAIRAARGFLPRPRSGPRRRRASTMSRSGSAPTGCASASASGGSPSTGRGSCSTGPPSSCAGPASMRTIWRWGGSRPPPTSGAGWPMPASWGRISCGLPIIRTIPMSPAWRTRRGSFSGPRSRSTGRSTSPARRPTRTR
jgi:beta-glucuronidase